MDEILNYEVRVEDDFYNILGCNEHSTTEQIQTEYKLLAKENHPDKRADDPAATEKFARIQQAKEVLCNEETRRDYDKWRNSGLAIPYKQWCARRAAMHTSMHWAVKKPQPMIQDDHMERPHTISEFQQPSSDFGWRTEPASDMIRQFRNYEI